MVQQGLSRRPFRDAQLEATRSSVVTRTGRCPPSTAGHQRSQACLLPGPLQRNGFDQLETQCVQG